MHRLLATGQPLLTFFIGQPDLNRERTVHIRRSHAARVLRQVPQQRLYELVVGWDRHAAFAAAILLRGQSP